MINFQCVCSLTPDRVLILYQVPGPERIVEVEKVVVQKEVEVKEVEKIIEIEVFRSSSGHVTQSPAVMRLN